MLWRPKASVRGFAQSPSTLFFEARVSQLNLELWDKAGLPRQFDLGSLSQPVSTDIVGGLCVGSADPACMAEVLSHLPAPPPIS